MSTTYRILIPDVTIEPGHDALEFVYRQTRLIEGELLLPGSLTPTGAKLRGSGSTDVPRPEDPTVMTITHAGTAPTGTFVAQIDYEGLEPLFLRSIAWAPIEKENVFAHRHARRRALIEEQFDPASDEYIAAMQWADFDEATDLNSSTESAGDSRDVRDYLLERAVQRSAYARAGLPMPAETSLPIALAGVPAKLEAYLIDALDAFHADGGSTLDLDVLRSHFAMFACGRLGLRGLTGDDAKYRLFGVPDGAMFFTFAEAALWFCELFPQRRSFWERIARIFIGAAETFVYVFWEGDRRIRTRYKRGPDAAPVPIRGVLDRIQDFERLDLEQLGVRFGAIVAHALAEEGLDLRIEGNGTCTRSTFLTALLRREGTSGDDARFDLLPADQAPGLELALGDAANGLRVVFRPDRREQELELARHVENWLEYFTFDQAGAATRLRFRKCDRVPSVYNPDTGQCDPKRGAVSFRWALETDKLAPCQPGVPADTRFEFTIGTPLVPA